MNCSEVAGLLSALKTGEVTLEEVADRFRHRSWPRTRRPVPATSLQLAEQQDPEPDVPGSYDDLTGAYDRGQLNAEQYDILSAAIAESIRAESIRARSIRERPAGPGAQPRSPGCGTAST